MTRRQIEWSDMGRQAKGRADRYRLIRAASAVPVTVTQDGSILHLEELAHRLVDAGVEYAEVVETVENPETDIVWDFFTTLQFGYQFYIGEVYRLADESLPEMVAFLVDLAGQSGADWLSGGVGEWVDLLSAWPRPPVEYSCAARAWEPIVLTIAARWGTFAKCACPDPRIPDTVDVVRRAVEWCDRDDLIQMVQMLVAGIEELRLEGHRRSQSKSRANEVDSSY